MVFTVCSLLIIAYLAPFGTISKAQPEDDWVAQPMHITQLVNPLASFSGYTPNQIRTAYNLPSSGGAGTTIAIVDAYDTPSIWGDLTAFSTQFGLPAPNATNFEVHKMATNLGTDSGWAEETCLDVEWAHAIAPDAKILLVEAVNDYFSSLRSAVDYATSYPGVVAVSMSWGGNESANSLNSDYHFNKPGIAFFAASGDDGSGIGTYWPASSPYVVAVGGTTLNLDAGGAVISETAWSKSGGGISNFEARPNYQTSYGLTTPNRTIPDVSYNANPTTGVAVYCNSSWINGKVGGTSAGAPQWAAIHALGVSATNINLYQRAKSSYATYFRDITSGSNGNYTATQGYDYVTGLGSPLTFKFGTSLEVSPTSGPPQGAITLNGLGFTAGSSVNISYLNSITSAWVPIINNLTTASENFTFSMNAPDLGQNNSAGDHQAAFDNIVFRAQDNSNNRLYNTTVPYSEMRRGLTQISNSTASGLFGNSTNLASAVFVQNGQSIPVLGNWFSPGTASLLWDDNISLGTAVIDGTGFFNTTMQVPNTTAGRHRLTINDGAANFCLNLTRLPTVSNDHIDGWHTSDFTINLAPDYAVNETFYRINDSPVFNATSNGQPAITAEGSSNKLEYWSTWDLYGTGITDLPHVPIGGIKLDKTAPTGSITPSSSNVNTPIITLSLSATDAVSGVAQMRFSNENSDWSTWEPYTTSKTWSLSSGDGTKTVNVQYMDTAGLTSSTYSCIVNLATPTPTPNPTTSPTIKPAATASPSTPTPTPSLSPTNSPTIQPSPTPQIPEVNIEMLLILLAASTLVLALIFKRSRK